MAFLVIGLVIGIATVVAMNLIVASMEAEVGKTLDEYGANILVVPKSDDLDLSYAGVSVGGVSFDSKTLENSAVDKIWGIENNENLNIISPKLIATDEINGVHAAIVGIDFESELKLKKWWKLNGTEPNSNEAMAGSEAAEKLGLSVGDSVKVKGKNYTVSAIISETGSQDDSLVFMPLLDAQELFGKEGQLSLIEVSAFCNTCPIDEMVAQISAALPNAKVTAVKQAVQSRMELVGKLSTFSSVISVVVLVIGSLIVFTTMMSSVNERTREIGIFRAIGFRKGHIAKIILLEAFLVSLAGGIAGYLLGSISAMAIAPMLTSFDLSLALNPYLAGSAILLSVSVGMASTIYPAWKASKLDPASALRAL